MQQIRKRVLSLVHKGAFTAAVTAAADFVRRNPELAEGYGLLAQAEEIAGYTKAAIKSVSKAIVLAPQDAAYRFQRGRLHLQIDAAADALEDMAHVLEMVKVQGNTDHIGAVIAYRDEALRRVQSGHESSSARNGHRPIADPSMRGGTASCYR